MKIKNILISKLRPAEYNPRKISAKQKEHLKKSITEFGEMEPAVINTFTGREMVIISGHQRIAAARELGKTEWPCVEVSLPIEKERELNIRMNKNTGEFDFDILDKLFEKGDLVSFGFDAEDFEEVDPPKMTEAKPYKMQHVMISYPLDLHEKIMGFLDKCESIPMVEIEKAAN